MHKRFQVLDLFHGQEIEEEDGPWREYSLNEKDGTPKVSDKGGKIKVKLCTGEEHFVYYCPDGLRSFYKIPCHFWTCSGHQHLTDSLITHWKYMKKEGD